MTGVVRARIDEDLKNEATAVLEAIGLTVSDVVRMVLTRIAKEKALPVGLVTPNAATVAAMREGREILISGKARFKDAQEMLNAVEAESCEEGG